MTPYRIAIDQTVRTIERRARNYRNLVLAVLLVSFLSVAWAVTSRSAVPLLGLGLLVPLCGVFFSSDSRVLDAWRSQVLKQWVARDLDNAAFRAVIRANPGLPKETTQGMLETLPPTEDLAAEQGMSTPTRRAIAAATTATYGSRSDAMALKSTAVAIVGGALIGAIVVGGWKPLTSLGGLLVLPAMSAWMKRRRFGECERQVTACRSEPGFSEAEFVRATGN